MTTAPLAGDPGRAAAVRDMFTRIAPAYDRANVWISLGIAGWWRGAALRELGDQAGGEVLDLCAGTLDFSVALAGRSRRVVAVDFCPSMLELGRDKLPAGAAVELVCADARELPLADGSVDAAIAGFGVRNVPEPERALAEVHRVLRPGGRFVVLDFFAPRSPVARLLDRTYNRSVLPLVGGFLSGERSAYRYLAESMGAWVDRPGFERLCTAAGFVGVRGRDLVPPVAGLVVAERAR